MFAKFVRSDVANVGLVKQSVARGIRGKLMEQYPMLSDVIEELMPNKSPCTIAKCPGRVQLVLVDGRVLFFNVHDGPFFPHLKLLHKFPSILPHMRVDDGAIRFVLQGANVMCPGLTSEGADMAEVEEDSVVAIMAEGKEHAIGVGLMLMGTERIRTENSGHGIESMHFLNDGLWRLYASLAKK
jgi:malignant T-cell-amplified sequence